MEYYHVYCRGIEQKETFIDDLDYDRFIQSLWVFNTANRVEFRQGKVPKEKLIDLVAFCLMPNHFHLLVYTETNIILSKYMQKVMTAYTMYLKSRYRKTGRVFESRYKSKHISDDRYLKQVIDYIHNNPLKLKYPKYRSIDLLDGSFILTPECMDWLNIYKYSSRNYTEVQPPLTKSLSL